MGIVTIFADSIALMIGSLLAAALLTFAAWWLADRMHRPWVGLVLLLAMFGGMLISPLEASLFVRMMAVFGIVGAALLYVMSRSDEGPQRP